MKLPTQQQNALNWLLKGKTRKEVALEMKISENGVKQLIKKVYQKFEVHTRDDLVDKLKRK